MKTLLLRVALIIVLLFAVAGATVALSAESLPDSALYPVKLTLEDAQLALVTDPVKEAELNLELAETRLHEITEICLVGKTLDETILIRLENHFDEALRLAAQMPDEAMAGFLVQTRDRIRIQEHDLAQTRTQVFGPGAEALAEANGLLNRLRLQVESGLREPQLFRQQHGGSPREAGPCNNGNCEPASENDQYNQENNGKGRHGPGDSNSDSPSGGNEHNQSSQSGANKGHGGG